MFVAKVVGNVVATKKDDRLTGKKLMIISPLRNGGYDKDDLRVAVDSVGAGNGEVVLVTTGSSARKAASNQTDDLHAPTDATIVGIIDDIEITSDRTAFGKEAQLEF